MIAPHRHCEPRVFYGAWQSRTPAAKSSGSPRPRDDESGLTLLEVLVALVILAVALTAIIKATAENIRATSYLQEKTVATWVGLNVLNKTRLELIQLPDAPEHRDVNELMLGQNWEWQGSRKNTGNARIHEIHVKVFHLPDHQFITELTSYLYVA